MENEEKTEVAVSYPSNSYSSREKKEEAPPPMKKVAHGTAVSRRKSLKDRLMDWLFVDEDEYEDFIYEDLIRPAILDAVWDIGNNAMDTIKDALGVSLFGSGRSGRRRRSGYYRTSYDDDDYSEYWNRERRGRRRSRRDRDEDDGRYSCRRSDDVAAVVETRREAVDLVQAMQERIRMYKEASVLNFYDAADMPTRPNDDNYGWDLGHPFEATISRYKGNYIVEPNAPIWLDR